MQKILFKHRKSKVIHHFFSCLKNVYLLATHIQTQQHTNTQPGTLIKVFLVRAAAAAAAIIVAVLLGKRKIYNADTFETLNP